MSEEDSEGSPVPLKRKVKKVALLSSGSESDSDDSVGVTDARRKRLRVMSDGESSSGSSVVGARRRPNLHSLRYSEDDSDISGWSTDHSDTQKPATVTLTAGSVSGFTSDSSEGNSDKCSICLHHFTNQEVGTPQNCEHIFCLDCISKWARNVNTCPVDRSSFDYIIVRSHAGGKVLCKKPVKVIEQIQSPHVVVLDDSNVCEVCRLASSQESMLLCMGCESKCHIDCLIPPLTEVPLNGWLCRICDGLVDNIYFHGSRHGDYSSFVGDLTNGHRQTSSRHQRNVTRRRNSDIIEQPSTSSGHSGNANLNESTITPHSSKSSRLRKQSRHRRRKRRTSKLITVEKRNDEYTAVKRVKRKAKKTKLRRPRTVARRSHVRASVRPKLVNLNEPYLVQVHTPPLGAQDLTILRHRAGITSLSLFGNDSQLDNFSDDETEVNISHGPMSGVAIRPTSSILNAYRQARRKMISIPSPPRASTAPDILSNIMESQTLLHSKNSIVSVSIDGNIDIKLKSHNLPSKNRKSTTNERLDLSKGEDASKKTPSYPGQSRGGGGWGGGYRGNYHRDQNSNNFNRGNNYGGNYHNQRQGMNYQNNMRRDDADSYNNYARRPQFSHNDDSYFDRSRRQLLNDSNRGPNYQQPQNQRLPDQAPPHQEPNRFSLSTSWQPFPIGPGPRLENPVIQNRHSFGGFDNPLDMRMGQAPSLVSSMSSNNDMFIRSETIMDKSQTSNNQPLPEPPIFNFTKMADVEKSEDEKSDSGLVIDTEKYDPTEPTNDDDSCEEEKSAPAASEQQSPPSMPAAVQNILAGIDTSTMNVPHNILDSAVRQVLKEHGNLIGTPNIQHNVSNNDKSDEETDGDCPNFSIYSATSFHIANNSSNLTVEVAKEVPQDNLEDLVQEDDDMTPPETTPTHVVSASETSCSKPKEDAAFSNKPAYSSSDNSLKKKIDEGYKVKVSKRCPITSSTRNPITIKLNTTSLLKRQLNLYDEDTSEENEPVDKSEKADKIDKVCKPEGISEAKRDEKHSHTINMTPNELAKQSTKQESKPVDAGTSTESVQSKESVLLQNSDTNITGNVENEEGLNKESEVENVSPVAVMVAELHGEIEGSLPAKILKEVEDDNDAKSDIDKCAEVNCVEESDLCDELCLNTLSPVKEGSHERERGVEKMTESLSETEDERSYTPCLDENKSKDTSLEGEKEKGIEGLDTEMISEEEEIEMFSENEKAPLQISTSLVRSQATTGEEDERVQNKKKESKREERDESKKKKKKEPKKESKDKNKTKNKKSDITFKKLSKSGKERNYRERDKEEKSKRKKDRSESSETAEENQKRRKEKRKDLERYDVRTVVTEKRKKMKDPFGRDISPRMRSTSLSPFGDQSPSRGRRSLSRSRRSSSRDRISSKIRRSVSRERKSSSRNRRTLSRGRGSLSRNRRSLSRIRKSLSRSRRSRSLGKRSASRSRISSSRGRLSISRIRASPVHGRKSPSRGRASQLRGRSSVARGRRSPSLVVLRRARASLSPRSATPRASPHRSPRHSPRRSPERKRRRSVSPRRRASPRRRRTASRGLKRRRSASRSPKPKSTKKKKRSRSERPSLRRRSPHQKSPKRKKNKRFSGSRSPEHEPLHVDADWTPPSVDSRLLSPRTPPPEFSPEPCQLRVVVATDDKRKRKEKRRRDPERQRPKRIRDAVAPSKEVFTSGDNILVSVSFQDQEREEEADKRRRRETKREKRKRKRTINPTETETVKPVAIIDLDRSPFRELTPSPKNVIVLSDSDHGEKEENEAPAPQETECAPTAEPSPNPPVAGPKTPPEPVAPPEAAASPRSGASARSAGSAASERSPDAYDPFEPTRSPSTSPRATASPRAMTLEAAQRTNLSADEVLARRPLSPIEKVLALLQSTRDEAPEPPPGPEPEPVPRVVLPEAPRAAPKLFVGKAEPIKSLPVKPMARREDEQDDSPYSPGSSDFGDLFEPPPGAAKTPTGKREVFDALFDKPPSKRKGKSTAAKVPVKLNKKKGIKTHVGVKIAEDNLKILDDLPSSAVEMQVKSKFLKKLNRQERVVEEVKLVLKPHYNKKHVTKEEYKDILRRAVPKICHNKSGEINPAKIQALVEAYVKKFRKKHKLGLA